jgi:Glycosyl hydrolases family 38 N-terminal domain/Glycosyl hydrolases family 38 C-terminal domain
MTQELLNKSLEDISATRKGLEDQAFSQVGELGGVALEYACPPLFRRAAGGLEQIVRFRCGEVAAGLEIRLEDEQRGTAHRGHFAEQAQGAVAELAVAEVAEDRRLRFVVEEPGGNEVTRGQVVVSAQRKWSVSLVHHTHLDVGYTDPQRVVLSNHLQYLDSVLDLVEATSDWPDDARFRWNVEVSWPLERWFSARGDRARRAMVDAIRAGSIGVGALSLNLHTEACSIEELYEMARFAVELRRREGIELVGAMQTDVPGGVPGLVEVLADAGVRYLSAAHNYAGRSVPYLIGGEHLERPFYWKSPSGKRLLVWFTDTAQGNAYMEGNIIGLADSYQAAAATLPYYLSALASRPYPFPAGFWLPGTEDVERRPYPHNILHLRVQGKKGDNAPPSLTVAEVVRAWNDTWAYPHLRLDLNESFFATAEAELGSTIPEYEGDWADWWADGLGSGARMLGYARQAQQIARSASTLHAVGDLAEARKVTAVSGLRHVYEDLGLFDEHTWGARHPWGDDENGWDSGKLQWERKAAFADRARESVESLADTAARRAAEALGFVDAGNAQSHGRSGLASILVLNPSGWARSEIVRLFVPFSIVPEGLDVVVADERDGRRLPTEAVPQEHFEHRPAGRFLVFRSDDIPACGYARFAVTPGKPVDVDEDPAEAACLENDHYRVVYDLRHAWISSVMALETKTELVATDAIFGMNGYIFDRYGTSSRVDHLSGRVFTDQLHLVAERAAAEHAVVTRRTSSELGETLTVDLRAPGCERVHTTVSLWRGVPRVEIENRLWKRPTTDKQSVFFAFPFNLTEPEVLYELPGLASSALRPSVPGSPRHMRAIRHFAALRGNHRNGPAGQGRAEGIAWATSDAALMQIGDLHSPYAPFPGTLPLQRPEPATVYSWALNNIWDTNFPSEQGGEMRFRYALAAASGQDVVGVAGQLGEEVTMPLTATVHPAAAPGPAQGSFCTIDRPEVRLVRADAAQSGDVAFWLNNCSEAAVTTTVGFGDLTPRAARLATVFEEAATEIPLRENKISVNLGPGETKAVVLDYATPGT